MSDDVLVVAEHRRGSLRDVSYELITAGAEVAEATGGSLRVAVIGGETDAFADKLDRPGVDVVHPVAYGEEFNHDVSVQAVSALIEQFDPRVVLLPNSVNGLDYAPALATARSRPLVTDAVGLALEDDHLIGIREMYGSKVETEVAAPLPAIVTVRPAEWPAAEGDGEATVEPVEVTIDEAAIGSTVTGYEEAAGGDVDISEADVLVSIGRGIDEEDNLDLIFELAEALDATVSSSRPIVDAGWLPKNRQVGQSGKTVTPDVYIAIGISGAVQHVAGMKGSDTIVAINTDPNAPIFDIADYGVVGDLFDVVPELIAEFGG
ncbi:MAG: electron transfer flavoprotein subunit alpha/FixB family protein [Halobacteriales archaeon]|nr:electron transfer flavoprotein subunit alpha/FixB family protein [Halobacteriales archaeon]